MNDFELVKGDFEKVLVVNFQNRVVCLQIFMCQRKVKEYNEWDCRVYVNMFKKFVEWDVKEEVSKVGSKKVVEGVVGK